MATSLWPDSERRDQRQEGVEIGRQVDVHVRDDGAVLADHAARRARPRPLLGEVDGPHAVELVRRAARDRPTCDRCSRCRRW